MTARSPRLQETANRGSGDGAVSQHGRVSNQRTDPSRNSFRGSAHNRERRSVDFEWRHSRGPIEDATRPAVAVNLCLRLLHVARAATIRNVGQSDQKVNSRRFRERVSRYCGLYGACLVRR